MENTATVDLVKNINLSVSNIGSIYASAEIGDRVSGTIQWKTYEQNLVSTVMHAPPIAVGTVLASPTTPSTQYTGGTTENDYHSGGSTPSAEDIILSRIQNKYGAWDVKGINERVNRLNPAMVINGTNIDILLFFENFCAAASQIEKNNTVKNIDNK